MWWIAVPVGLAAAATLATLLFMAAAISPARFRYIAPEPALRDYALRLVEAELAHPEVGAMARAEDVAAGLAQPEPGFPRWIGSTGPKAAETLAKLRISSFTRHVRQDSATWSTVRA